MTNQAEQNGSPMDYLDFYKHMTMELFSGNDLSISLIESDSPLLELDRKKHDKPNVLTLFQKGMVCGISDCERETLQGILNESLTSLHWETDKILDDILAMLQIEAYIKELPQLGECNEKQIMRSGSFCKCFGSSTLDVKAFQPCGKQVHVDFQDHLRKGRQPKEALEICSKKLKEKLGCLEQFLEDYLDLSLSKCRPMTNAEKQQLGQRIHRLPTTAVDRVAKIIQHRKPNDPINNIIHVDLDKEDDVTLWRLYCYVETVAKASK